MGENRQSDKDRNIMHQDQQRQGSVERQKQNQQGTQADQKNPRDKQGGQPAAPAARDNDRQR